MNLSPIFEPKSIAVFGVSRSNPFNPANVIFTKNHLRYQAATYAINPSGGELYGQPLYRNIDEVPEVIDFAVFAIRASLIPEAMSQCIQAGVKGAIIISGGFAEAGHGDLQTEIQKLATQHDFPVVGPNCLGIFSPPFMDVFFLPHERLVAAQEGSVALISQSGGILVDLMIKLTQEGTGLSRAISIGNKAVIDEVDLVTFLSQDKKTRVIGIYNEGFRSGRGRAFVDLVMEQSKPVVMLKSGKTPGGSRAVSSHTASLAGDYATFNEVMKQCGVLEARNEAEFVAFCEALSRYERRAIDSVCIVTGSGGHGAMASDVCFVNDLNLVDLSQSETESLMAQLSPSIQEIASLKNPIDLTGSARDDDFVAAVHFALNHPSVSCVLLLLLPYLPGLSFDIGARISQEMRAAKKPIVTYIPRVEKFQIFVEGFESNGVPVSHSVEGAVQMARAIRKR